MGLSAYPSTLLRCSTFTIMRLLTGAGRRVHYAAHVSGTIGLLRTNSYPCALPPAHANVIYLRQPPSLRSIASYTLYHITRNLAEFTLTFETTYLHYLQAVKSNFVPADKLIPDSFPQLRCTFAWGRDYGGVKRYHKACVDPSHFPWYTHTREYGASKYEVIVRLCTDKHE